ncbi:MAG: hypothetical protein AAGA48_22960 [Myxococcota bacterium]
MRPAAWWGLGVAAIVVGLGVFWWSLTKDEASTKSKPPQEPQAVRTGRVRVAPADPNGYSRLKERPLELKAQGLRRFRPRFSALTAEAVDKALNSQRSSISECIEAVQVHGAQVPSPLSMTLSLEPKGPNLGLRVASVTTKTDGPALDPCLTNALGPVTFTGEEAVEIRASWPPAP